MVTVHTVCAVPYGETFLLDLGSEGVLVDAGYDYGSDRLALGVRELLGDRPLTAVLATHSHYDHFGGCAGVQELFPQARVFASVATADLLGRESVRQTMRAMNEAVGRHHPAPYESRVDRLRVDRALRDGETFDLGPLRVTALETPGHTRCSMSYYIHSEDLLICCESVAAWIGGRLLPTFLSSYPQALESIRKCAATNPRRIVVPHYGEFTAMLPAEFFRYAGELAQNAARFVYDRHREGMDEAAIAREYMLEYYPDQRGMNPEAVRVNCAATVGRLLALCAEL